MTPHSSFSLFDGVLKEVKELSFTGETYVACKNVVEGALILLHSFSNMEPK